ncbi:MAG: GTPase Era [Actinobacteria bacterium]|nr:GTPase Era [Actinomycetota bacterium]
MDEFRSGFVALVGRPNTGKSTLLNSLVGEKIAITSTRPQTTRRAIRGIVNRANGQVILVDTPGIHKPKTLLGERLNALVAQTYSEVDLIICCLPADEEIGPGDKRIISEITAGSIPLIAVVTKSDRVAPPTLMEKLASVGNLAPWKEIIPVSAKKDINCEKLLELLIANLPEGPALYPEDYISEESEHDIYSELIREAALELLNEELPHSLMVTIEEVTTGEDGKTPVIYGKIFLERDSQKKILLGKSGERIKEIGTKARLAIEAYRGERVFLKLHVGVESEWQRNPRALEKFGF